MSTPKLFHSVSLGSEAKNSRANRPNTPFKCLLKVVSLGNAMLYHLVSLLYIVDLVIVVQEQKVC